MSETAAKADRIRDLERIISHLDTLYERGDDCLHPDTGILVTDGEYDVLRRDLRQLAPDSPLFDTASASLLDSIVQKVVHDPPMTSIEKASHEDPAIQQEQLFKWLSGALPANYSGPLIALPGKTYKGQPVSIPAHYFYATYKLDGVALAIYYEQGRLVRAGLRPRDGIHGEDVTRQCHYVRGIPEQLKTPVSCSIRGELVCQLSDFEIVQRELELAGQKLRANPRNHAAGGIRQFRNPEKTQQMRLSFIAYGIEGLANPPYQTEIERAEYCREQLGVPYIETGWFEFEDLARMEDAVPSLDVEVDGVIVGVDNLEDQTQLGRHGDPRTGNPKGKIAWKFREEEATPVIRDIEWKTGRTGKVTAVAIFDPVRLAGTNVSRATLHNAGFMERNQISVGSTISVRKAGKIIPKVTGVIAGQASPDFPQSCPACGTATELRQGGSDEMLELICPSKACPAQIVSSLCHFLDTCGVLGLGESRVTSLVEGNQVAVPADFFALDVEDVMACGLTHRQSALAVAAIQMIPSPDKQPNLESLIAEAKRSKKRIPLWKLMAAFGIEAAGKSAGKTLSNHFGSLEKIRAASIEELQGAADIGEKTAMAIHNYLQQHARELDRLLQYVDPVLPPSGGALAGQRFCFSGGFPAGKRFWEQQVEAAGGTCTGSVSRQTNYLVAGSASGSKSDKAKQLGIPIIDTVQLQALLDGS